MIKRWKEEFQEIPLALKNQILLRAGAGTLCLFLLLVIAIVYQDIYLCLSFILFGGVFIISGLLLFRRSVRGAYVVLSGACQRIEQTAIRRRTKVIYFTVSPHTVRVNLKRWVKDLAEGDGIVLYVADNTPVYEKDGCQVLNGYWALEIRKGSDGDE